MFPTSQVLKFPKSEILAGDHAKEFCFFFFFVEEMSKNSRGVHGHASPENF